MRKVKKTKETIKNKRINLNILQSPKNIESSFRKRLGQHNIHFTLLELMSVEFNKKIIGEQDFGSFLRELSKEQGYHSTYPNSTSFTSTHNYLILSHMAYCFSAGDYLCTNIRNSDYMKHHKKNNEALFNKIDEGDFVKKTLSLIFLASLPSDFIKTNNIEKVANDIIDSANEKIKNDPSFSILDYYRNIRNIELHSIESKTEFLDNLRNELPLDKITKTYKITPSHYTKLASQDALLCSYAWINAGRWLCKNMFNTVDFIIPEIKARFNNLKAEKRILAASNFLSQQLLYTPEEISVTIEELGWSVHTVD